MTQTATNPQTGERIVQMDGEWVSYTQSATNPQTGSRAFLIDGQWRELGGAEQFPSFGEGLRANTAPDGSYTGGDLNDYYRDQRKAANEELLRSRGGRVGAGILGLAQGAAANFGDEAANASPLAGADNADEVFADAWDTHPASYGTGYTVGSLVGVPGKVFKAGSALVTNAGTRALPTAARTGVQGVGGGALAGAVHEAGFAKGDVGDRVDDTRRGAAYGGVTGGVLGAAGPYVSRAAGAIGRRLPGFNRIGARDRGAAMLGRALQDDDLTEAGLSATAREINQRAGATTPSGAGSLNVRAAAQAERSGRSPATLLDVARREGGDNTLTLAEAAAGRGGRARQMVEAERLARGAERGERVRGRLAQLNPADDPINADEVGVVMQRQAEPLYAQAFGAGANPRQVSSTTLAPLFETGGARGALNQARTLAQYDRAPTVVGEIDELIQLARSTPADQISAMLQRGQVSLRAVDYVKRAMQERISVLQRQGRPAQARAMQSVLRGFDDDAPGILDLADAEAPVYARARSVWERGRSAQEAIGEAIDAGGEIWRPRSGHADWMSSVRGWRGPLRENAQRAAYEDLLDRASENVSAFANRFNPRSQTYNPQRVERLRALFGDDLDDVLAGVIDEAERLPSINSISSRTNSATARRLTAQSELDEEAADLAIEMAAGTQNPLAAAMSVARRVLRGERGLTETESAEMVRLLLQPYTPSGVRDVINRALQAQRARAIAPPSGQGTVVSTPVLRDMREQGQ